LPIRRRSENHTENTFLDPRLAKGKSSQPPDENLLLLLTNSLAEETNRSRSRKSANISRALAQVFILKAFWPSRSDGSQKCDRALQAFGSQKGNRSLCDKA
ncbi:hypothetical protein J6590_105435, partial [Homalodisca vitripennis]